MSTLIPPIVCCPDPAGVPVVANLYPAEPLRPRYFPGQQPTDGDFNQGTRWADERIRLHRLRQGWGVVCGLGVKSTVVDNHPALAVEPGYAVAGLGEDIVVECEATISLKKFCQSAQGPCAEGRRSRAAARPEEKPFHLGTVYEVPNADLLTLYLVLKPDLRLHQWKTMHLPHTPGCLGEEASRIRETYRLCVQTDSPIPVHPKDEVPPGKVFLARAVEALSGKDEDKRKDWLHQRATAATSVPILPAVLRAKEWKPHVPELVAWLLLDVLATTRAAACKAKEAAVPLARIYLKVSFEACRILAVDATPPYRRPYGLDDPKPGLIDLRPYLGAEWTLHEAWLKAIGGTGIEVTTNTPPGELLARLYPDEGTGEESKTHIVAGRPFDVLWYDLGDFGKRILGFLGARPAESEQGPVPTPDPDPPAPPGG